MDYATQRIRVLHDTNSIYGIHLIDNYTEILQQKTRKSYMKYISKAATHIINTENCI